MSKLQKTTYSEEEQAHFNKWNVYNSIYEREARQWCLSINGVLNSLGESFGSFGEERGGWQVMMCGYNYLQEKYKPKVRPFRYELPLCESALFIDDMMPHVSLKHELPVREEAYIDPVVMVYKNPEASKAYVVVTSLRNMLESGYKLEVAEPRQNVSMRLNNLLSDMMEMVFKSRLSLPDAVDRHCISCGPDGMDASPFNDDATSQLSGISGLGRYDSVRYWM